MAADDIGPGLGKDLCRLVHDLGQRTCAQGFGQAGQDDLGKRRLWFCAHGKDVAQRVIGRDAGHEAGIVGQRAQMVSGDNLHARGRLKDRRIIAAPGQHIGPCGGGQRGEGRSQPLGPEFRPAAAAERLRPHRLHETLYAGCGWQGLRHGRAFGEHRHEIAVNAVFDPPEPRPAEAQAEFVGHRTAPAGRHQFEIVALGVIGLHHPARQGCAQVVVQNGCLAHRKDPGFGARRMGEIRAIARSEDQRVGALQGGTDGDKALAQRKPGVGQPTLRPGSGDREGEIAGQHLTGGEPHGLGRNLGHFGPGNQADPGAGGVGKQTVARAAADIWQNGGAAFDNGDRRGSAKACQPVLGGKR